MRIYDIKSKFTNYEFKCKCGCDFGTMEKDIDPNLINRLNMIRILYGKPMVVTSGARCKEYNAKIGGLPDSAHLRHASTRQCRAVDIYVNNGFDRYDLIQLALHVGFTRFGLATDFLHLDVAWDLPDPVMFNY